MKIDPMDLMITIVMASFVIMYSVNAAYFLTPSGTDVTMTKTSNTDQCLTDCYLDLRFQVDKDYSIDTLTKFTTEFVKEAEANNVKQWGYKILKNESYQVWISDRVCTPKLTINLTEYLDCTDKGHYEARYRDVWEEFDPLGKTLKAGEWYTVRTWAKRKPVLGQNNIDAVPDWFDRKFNEFAWWNSSWDKCKDITITEISDHDTIDTEVEMDLTGLTFSSTDELRIVNASCEDDGSEIPFDIITNTSNSAFVAFMANLTASGNTVYSVYYDNSGAGAPTAASQIANSTDCTAADCTITVTSNSHTFSYIVLYDAGVIQDPIITSSENLALDDGSYELLQVYGGGSGWIFDESITTTTCAITFNGKVKFALNCTGTSTDYINYVFWASGKVAFDTNLVSTSNGAVRLSQNGNNDQYAYNGTNVSGIGVGSFDGTTDEITGLATYNASSVDFWTLVWDATNVDYINHTITAATYDDLGRDYALGYALGTGYWESAFHFSVNGDQGLNVTQLADLWIDLYRDPPTMALGIEETQPLASGVNNVTIISPANGTINTSVTVEFAYQPYFSQEFYNCSLWTNETSWTDKELNGSVVTNATTNYISETFGTDGSYSWAIECYNISDPVFSDTGELLIDTTPPVVDVEKPTGVYTRRTAIPLDFSVNDAGVGVSECWYQLNGGTNVSVLTCSNTTFNVATGDNYTIILWSNDTENGIGSDTATFSVEYYELSTQSYEPNVIESDTQTFAVTFTTENIQSISVDLYHNGTDHGFDTFGSKTITIPNITVFNETVSFSWNITVGLSNGTIDTNTTESVNQTIYQMVLTNCTGITDELTLELYLLDEDDGTEVNGSIDMGATVWINDTVLVRQYSFDWANVTNASVCIYPAWANYTLDANIEYDAEDYFQRTYNINDLNISNISQRIDLYLITGGKVVIYTKDSNDQPVEGITVNVERYYPATGTYLAVLNVNSDSQGKIVTWLGFDTVWYRFTLFDGATEVNAYDPMVIVDTLNDPEVLNLYVGSVVPEYYEMFDVTFDCYYDSPNNVSTCSLTDTTGYGVTSCLSVQHVELLGVTEVCYECNTSAIATINCTLNQPNGTYKYTFSLMTSSDSFYVLESDYIYIPGTNLYGSYGLFLAIMIVVTTVFLGVVTHPAVGGMLSVIGLAFSASMGFMELAIGSFVGLMFISVIIIYGGRKGV